MNDMHEVLHREQGAVNQTMKDACVACTGDCASCKIMDMASRRDRLEAAGCWLRRARERRGYHTAADFARVLQVDQSLVSRYERGISAVGDERAEQIAQVLRMDIIDVRSGLGLWVPSESGAARPSGADDAELQELITQAEDNPALRDALLAVKRMNEARQQTPPPRGRKDESDRRAG
jgi:transcriptional regulator with XRE-family HTH domain